MDPCSRGAERDRHVRCLLVVAEVVVGTVSSRLELHAGPLLCGDLVHREGDADQVVIGIMPVTVTRWSLAIHVAIEKPG
jgi:hypothetical protein